MAGIGIVTNPHSRRNRKDPERMRRLGYILGRDDVYEMTSHPDDVRRVAEEFKKSQIAILALNGGDGTNHVTLTHFIEVYGDEPLPKIALLRGGTMNTLSEAVGVRGTPGKILLNLVEKYYTGQTFDITDRHILKITDETGTRYGFIFGNGVIANFLDIYYETGNPSPPVAARLLAQTALSAFVGGALIKRVAKPFEAEVELDGEVWPSQEYIAVMASTVEQIGLGFRPFLRCQERAGAFHVGAVFGPVTKVVAGLPRMRFGLKLSPEVYKDAAVGKAVFRSPNGIVYTIDGDMHRAQREVTVEAGPRLEIILG